MGNRWTEERDRRLVELWRGNSVTEICISGEFNGFSRNAIIGRVYRLRKKWGSDMVPFKQSGHGVPAVKKKRVRRKTPNFNIKDRDPPMFAAEPTPIKTPPAPPTARRLPLLELGPKDCRFIVTDHHTRQHLYCAVDASAFADDCGNNCYCDFHRRLMRSGGVVR
jgi:hypothetical protein